jgi:V-type H+-transporting ATPase subunit a
MLFIKPCFFRK